MALDCEKGTFVLTGVAITFNRTYVIKPECCAFLLLGQNANFPRRYVSVQVEASDPSGSWSETSDPSGSWSE
jgi:hypothetical protein